MPNTSFFIPPAHSVPCNLVDELLPSAIQKEKYEIAKFLIDEGVDVNALNSSGKIPLQYATEQGALSVVQELLDKGADANISLEWTKEIALHLSVRAGWTRITQLLIKAHSNVNAQNCDGKTPLHLAVEKGFLDALEALLKVKSIAINLKDHQGYTPAHLAIRHGHTTLLKQLIQSGAELGIQDNTGESALDCAKRKQDGAMRKVLKRAGAYRNKDLCEDEQDNLSTLSDDSRNEWFRVNVLGINS